MPMAAPNARRAPSMSRRPMLWPTMIVAAMPKPKAPADRRNTTRFALTVAARAFSPSSFPSQTVLMEPFSDCSTLDARVGTVKAISVHAIGPVVRSRGRVGPSAAGRVAVTPVGVACGASGGGASGGGASGGGRRAARRGCPTSCCPLGEGGPGLI